jgi:DNA-binding winged helix-turn-helix (wHTH) protein
VNNVSINIQAERVTRPFWGSANTASSDLVQNVTSQLRAYFRAQGRVLPIADEPAQKVTSELTARVREVIRRPDLGASWISGVMQAGDLKLHLQRHVLWRRDDEIHLSPKEFDLLAFMMKNADVLLTHTKLLRSVWGWSTEANWSTCARTSARCAKDRKEPANPEYIVSEPSIGYRFRIPKGLASPSFQAEQQAAFTFPSPRSGEP